ncbi:MAG: putative peptide zinc metalloprotease protein [Frankiaceae bacterium]|nr:putative peptide zinc metalloprotease protein [Frankiaceae bacterium]
MTLAVNRQRSAAAPQSTPQSATEPRPPRLADGVTLLGEYEGSGYTSPHYLARRKSGSVVQLTELLFLVADACDGQRSVEQIAAQVSERHGKTLTADNVESLLGKLRPIGVVTEPDGSSREVADPDPLLALRWRVSLVGKNAVSKVVRPFLPLFLPPIIALVCVGLVAMDYWLFFRHGLAQPIRQTVEDPVTFLLVAALVIVSAAFHEVGHATACVYSGGKPGRMGAGVYLAWPAFYTDVTDAYRLSRSGRLRTDLGGIYFNAVFVLAMTGVFFGTTFEPLLLVVFLMQVEIVQQLLPFLRLDGYYVLSDIAGVPDLFRRIPGVMRSMLPGRGLEKEVAELKRWVRVMVITWTLVVVPLLLVNLVLAIVSAPRILATAWHSGAKLVYNFEHAGALLKAADALQIAFLAVPIAGLVFTFLRLGRRAGAGAWRWSAGSAPRRTMVLSTSMLILGLLAFSWWPDGRTTPYRPGERGTLTQQLDSFQTVGQGSPYLPNPHRAATQPLTAVAPGTTAGDLAQDQTPAAPAGTTTDSGTTPATPAPSPVPTDSASTSPSPAASPSASTEPSSSPSPSASASSTP